jgi:LuxR family transcriptional regulator, maltose regulon positive regulatory protein
MNKIVRTSIWPDDLLVTKLNIPSPHFKVMQRSRLTKYFAQNESIPLITVVAPAGYGKTTFISDSLTNLKEEAWRIVWLSLDSQDNSAIRFWSYIIAGINRETSINLSTNRLLQQTECFQIPLAITPIINTIADWQKPIIVVLDDYHNIDNDTIHESVEYLINHSPTNLHLIISSRKAVPFSLFRQKMEHKLLEICADELAFTLGETNDFLNTTMGLGLNQDKVGSFFQMTEGWIVALQLLAISIHANVKALTNHPDTTNRDQLSDYLLTEILNQQPEEVREFLIQSSILKEISPDFCDYVLQRSNSHQMLEIVRNANLFIVSIDKEQKWFRYHPLFARALQVRLSETDPGRCKTIFRRAYQWLKENGYSFNAVSYALNVGDIEQAADIIEESALQAIIQSDTISLVQWINQISEEIKANRPNLILLNLLATLLLGQAADIQPDLQRLEALIQPGSSISISERERNAIAWKIRVIRTVVIGWKGNFVKEIPSLEELIRTAPDVEPYFLGFLNNSLSEAYGLSEDLQASMACFERTTQFSLESGFNDEYLNGICEIGRLLEMQGKITEARNLYSKKLEANTTSTTKNESRTFLQSGLLSVELIQNNLDSARKLAEGLSQIYLQEFSQGFPWIYQATILIRLANYFIAIGREGEAYPYLDKVFSKISTDQWSGCKLVEGYIHLQTQIWLRDKKFHVVHNWLGERITQNGRSGVQSTEEKVMLAMLFIEQDRGRDALPILTELEIYLKKKGLMYSLVKVYILLSVAHSQLRNREKSLSNMKKALEIAMPERMIQPFLRLGSRPHKVLKLLMEELVQDGEEVKLAGFGCEILEQANQGCEKTSTPHNAQLTARRAILKQILTDREIRVFDQILDGKSEKDIANADLISINTVKAHIRNIYKKLKIHSRREAHRWLQEG